jgi:hypothetical protein
MNVAELKALLVAEGFDPAAYSIEGPLPAYEGLILHRIGDTWVIEHFERGMRRPLESPKSEDEACRRMHALMSKHFR